MALQTSAGSHLRIEAVITFCAEPEALRPPDAFLGLQEVNAAIQAPVSIPDEAIFTPEAVLALEVHFCQVMWRIIGLPTARSRPILHLHLDYALW
jgi:hypothetical protein